MFPRSSKFIKLRLKLSLEKNELLFKNVESFVLLYYDDKME